MELAALLASQNAKRALPQALVEQSAVVPPSAETRTDEARASRDHTAASGNPAVWAAAQEATEVVAEAGQDASAWREDLDPLRVRQDRGS